MDVNLVKPRHEVAMEQLEELLQTLPAGAKLPPVRNLMQQFNVSQATLDRALRAVEKKGLAERLPGHGYFRNDHSKRRGSPLNIDFCFFFRKYTLDNPLYSAISETMLREMGRLGCHMNILAYEDMGSVAEFRERIQRNAPQAFITLGNNKVTFCHGLRELGIPVIQLYPNAIEREVLSYIIDNRQALRLALDHLCGFGHRRIAMFHGQGHDGFYMLDQEERIEAYYAEMNERQLPTCGELVKYGGYTPELGYAAARELLELPERRRPTAIMCNDYNAAGVYLAASECGLRVPDDISLLGFDHLKSSAFMIPRLTSIDICWKQTIKDVSARAFQAAQTGRQDKGLIRTAVELCPGASVGPAPGIQSGLVSDKIDKA